MKNIALNTLLSLALALGLSSAQASVLDTATTSTASQAELYGVFHDCQTDFVFVNLPQGWMFAGRDELKTFHEVFHDPSTGFVFVKLSAGWKFLGSVNA
jgi:hypothetical protein